MGCAAPGQRLLRVQIEVDGETMFQGMRGVPDSMPVEQMWSELDSVSFQALESDEDAAVGSGQASSDKERRLSGEVVVRILHVERELSKAQSNVLDMQSQNGTDWYFVPGEA